MLHSKTGINVRTLKDLSTDDKTLSSSGFFAVKLWLKVTSPLHQLFLHGESTEGHKKQEGRG